MKRVLKFLFYVCLLSAGVCLLAAIGLLLWPRHGYHLPSEQLVRKEFEDHRSDYAQFVTLLRSDHSAHFIDDHGRVDIHSAHSRLVPEYADLIRKIGAKFVIARQGGSIEFVLHGSGCAICSDSYMGVLYVPKDRITEIPMEWQPTVVTSLDNAKLPQEKGAVASGRYVIPIEPEWFVYRSEYQE